MRTIDERCAKHIFRKRAGHLYDTPSNRRLLEELANDPSSLIAADQHGNSWYARTDVQGNQAWVQVRGERIINGGMNNPPRLPNPHTGLSAGRRP